MMVVAVVRMEGKRKGKVEERKGEGSTFLRMWDEGTGGSPLEDPMTSVPARGGPGDTPSAGYQGCGTHGR